MLNRPVADVAVLLVGLVPSVGSAALPYKNCH